MQVAKRSGDVVDQKRRARTAANAARTHAHKTLGERAGLMLAQHELPVSRMNGQASVSGFYPYQDEINVLPLLARLVSEGWQTALPVVMAIQLLGGRLGPRPSPQMYQSLFGLVRERRDSRNHGC